MKNILFLTLLLSNSFVFCQQKEKAEKLIEKGIAYHDKGKYDSAIILYNEALQLDRNNLAALSEKAFSFLAMKKYDESISICRKAIKVHPGEEMLKTLYVYYGTALDGLKKRRKAVKKYDEGIKQFPDFYLLPFNKGITLTKEEKYDEAISCFQRSVLLNPQHASSDLLLARVLYAEGKKIPALLAYGRFFALEPESKRAKENLPYLIRTMKGDVEKTNSGNVNIQLNMAGLNKISGKKKVKENDFSAVNMILSLSAALDYDEKNKDKTQTEQFIRKFKDVCSFLKESGNGNYGFYWEYYVPYFVEMKDRNLITTFAYIAFASADDPEVSKWLQSHKKEIRDFYNWSKGFNWKTN